jgi:hypothetical protein
MGRCLHDKIGGNPYYWATLPTPATNTIAVANYSEETTAAANRTELASWIMTECTVLEIDWGVKLYDTSSSGAVVLTTTGQTYFTTVIPGLGSVCPSIMAVVTATPTWTDETPVGTSAASAWIAQWDGTSLKRELTKWGTTWGVPWNSISGGILFIFMIFAAAFSQLKWGNGDAGFMVGEAFLVIGTFAGLIYWAIVGVNMIILGWWTAHNIFWKNG